VATWPRDSFSGEGGGEKSTGPLVFLRRTSGRFSNLPVSHHAVCVWRQGRQETPFPTTRSRVGRGRGAPPPVPRWDPQYCLSRSSSGVLFSRCSARTSAPSSADTSDSPEPTSNWELLQLMSLLSPQAQEW